MVEAALLPRRVHHLGQRAELHAVEAVSRDGDGQDGDVQLHVRAPYQNSIETIEKPSWEVERTKWTFLEK